MFFTGRHIAVGYFIPLALPYCLKAKITRPGIQLWDSSRVFGVQTGVEILGKVSMEGQGFLKASLDKCIAVGLCPVMKWSQRKSLGSNCQGAEFLLESQPAEHMCLVAQKQEKSRGVPEQGEFWAWCRHCQTFDWDCQDEGGRGVQTPSTPHGQSVCGLSKLLFPIPVCQWLPKNHHIM